MIQMKMLAKITVFTIKVYQLVLSPLFSPCCRFYPSCSEYTIQAVERYGFLKGLYRGLTRLLRCHPLSQGGYDPIK